MMKSLRRRFIRMAVWWLALAGLLASTPVATLGSHQIRIDFDDRDGDPIDGNDYGNGGSGGIDDAFDRDDPGVNGIQSSSMFVLPTMVEGTRIMIVPEFSSGVFMVRFVFMHRSSSPLETDHVQ